MSLAPRFILLLLFSRRIQITIIIGFLIHPSKHLGLFKGKGIITLI